MVGFIDKLSGAQLPILGVIRDFGTLRGFRTLAFKFTIDSTNKTVDRLITVYRVTCFGVLFWTFGQRWTSTFHIARHSASFTVEGVVFNYMVTKILDIVIGRRKGGALR